jgi:hypothetical protein
MISKAKKTYLLSSQMTRLIHEMDISSSCGPEDADFTAFVEATSLISDWDVVEEFLAGGLWPLGFSVETKESPLSMVIVLVPQIGTAIGERESGAKFAACIEKAANELVGWYNLVEHKAYKGLHHGRLNRVSMLAGFLYQPRPDPAGCKRKMKSFDAVMAPVSRKLLESEGEAESWHVLKRAPPLKRLWWLNPWDVARHFQQNLLGIA